MKTLIIVLFSFPAMLFAQERAPFKGARKIIVEYPIGGDSLYIALSKSILSAGYKLDKRDKELLLFSTEPKHIKFVDYKMQVYIEGNKAIFSGLANSGMSTQIGMWKTDSQWMDVEFRAKTDLRRNCFDDIMSFVNATTPITVTYSK